MLADWYYCTCIGASPATAQAILSIFAAFEQEQSDSTLIAVAYDELSRGDARTQLYALPSVLTSLWQRGELHQRSLVRRYFDEITESARDADRAFVSATLDAVLRGAIGEDPDALLRPADEDGRPLTGVPYLDLLDFTAEAVVLSVMATAIQHGEHDGSRDAIVDALGQERSELRQLVDRALDNRFGRLPCRLAARIACRVALGRSPERIQSELCAAGVAVLEPDLLDAIVDVLGSAEPERTPEERAKAFFDETEETATLARISEGSPVSGEAEAALRRRVGINPGIPVIDLSAIYWRALLRYHAAALAPAATATWLASIWLPRGGSLSKKQAHRSKSADRLRAADEFTSLSNPWLEPAERFPYYWHAAHRGEVMLNLFGASIVARRLLESDIEDMPRDRLLLFVAHASDVVHDTYRDWLMHLAKEGGRPDAARVLSSRLSGLALFVRDMLDRVGGGHLKAVEPVAFVGMLERAHDGAVGTPGAEQDFVRRILPRVLVRWVEGAYASAVLSAPSCRWLSLVDALYDYYLRAGIDGDFARRLRAACLVRFLAGRSVGTADPTLDWRHARPGGQPLHWRLHHRQLLLTEPHLAVDVWRPEGWDEPDEGSPLYFVRALERLAVYAGLSPEERASDPTLKHWRNGWLPLLQTIREEVNLDRFVRLRLLEIFELSLLDVDEQEEIVSVILEFGSAYDMARLFQLTFPETVGGPAVAVAPARGAVQASVIRGAARVIDRYERGLAVRKSQGPRSPYRSSYERTQIDVLRAELTRQAAQSSGGGATILRSLLSARLMRDAGSVTASARADIVGDQLSGAGAKASWFHHAIVVDRNQMMATVFADRLALASDDFNGFQASDGEWAALAVGSDVSALAFATLVRPLDPEYAEYAFNVGVGRCISLRLRRTEHLPEGVVKAVRVRLRRTKVGTWSIDYRSVEWLVPKFRVGDLRPVSVKELTSDPAEQRFERRLWDADLSRHFPQAGRMVGTIARLREDGRWAPVDHDLGWLLLNGFKFGDVAVLTFIEKVAVDDISGLIGWRVSAGPGENYVLARWQFTPESVARIELEVQDAHHAYGLLIVVRAVISDGVVQLDLVESVDNASLGERYPSLRPPFDRRNIEWASLFKPGTPERARRDGAGWCIDEPDRVPGFPQTVPVTFQRQPSGQVVELTVASWEPRRGQIVGEAMATSTVEPEQNDWSAFLARWLEPARGQRVEIARVIGDPDRYEGLTPCITSENVRIFVEGESLTLDALTPGASFGLPRPADVVDCQIDRGTTRAELEIDLDADLASVLGDAACSGILTKKPVRPRAEALCEIVWQGASPRPIPVTIRGLKDLWWISQGTVIDAVPHDSGWRFFPRRTRVVARALWSLEKAPVPAVGALYLDAVGYRGRQRAIVQLSPGRAALLAEPIPNARHLARLRVEGPQGGWSSEERIQAFVHPELLHRREAREHRLILRTGGANYPARSRQRVAYGQVRLTSVRVQVDERGPDLVALTRFVGIRFEQAAPKPVRPLQARATQEQVWQVYLSREDRELEVRVERRVGEFFVQLPEIEVDEKTGEAQLQIPVGDAGWAPKVRVVGEDGPLVPHIEYATVGKASLLQLAGGEWVASFRTEPGNTARLCADLHARIGIRETLGPVKLVYVGAVDPSNPDTDFLFEYGYGRIARIPQAKLLWDGEPFRVKTELLLYSGDRITAVTFYSGEVPEGEPADETPPILSINAVDLFSEARMLYRQRADHRIVHVLRVGSVGGRLRVVSIEGLDDGSLNEERRPFRAVTATLAPETSARLEARMQGKPPGTILTLYGRLDAAAFQQTQGRELRFDHVRFTFLPSADGSPLQSGERIFLRCDVIETQRNETHVAVRPELDPEDIGPEIKKGGARILRRNFSVREELLRRILEDPQRGPKALQGRLVLARVVERMVRRREGQSRSFLHLSLKEQPPCRRLEALEGALQRGPVVVAIAEIDAQSVVVEVRPTVFVRFPRDRMAVSSDPIESGAIMRVEKTRDGFLLSLASFSDRRYAGARPAVALPKNDIFNLREGDRPDLPGFWTQRFSVGDLPGLLPQTGHFDSSTGSWSKSRPQELIALMRMPHPKLVTLGRHNDWEKVSPSISVPSGKLVRSDHGIGVTFKPLPGSAVGEVRPLEWRTLTFGDESALAVSARIDNYRWRYHDRTTVTWLPDGAPAQDPLGWHSAWTGPLFFQPRGDALSLRYTNSELLDYGGPVDLLVDALRDRGSRSTTLPVAAVANDGKGLWVEIVPGRVAELPGPIVSESTTGAPLSRFHWRGFAPGDRVTLKLSQGEAYGIDTIALEAWRPGPRQLFEGRRAHLPITHFDPLQGALSVGVGDWSLQLPVEDVPADRAVATLADGTLQLLSDADLVPNFLKTGDVVLLSHDGEGKPVIAGWPRLTPSPHVREGLDLLTSAMVSLAEGRPVFSGSQFTAILDSMGGSIPVCVDEIDADILTIYVSRRSFREISAVPPESITSGSVVARLGDGRVLVRIGGSLHALGPENIVSGLPPAALDAAVEALRVSRAPLWFRADSAGRLRMGLFPDTHKEFSAEGVSVIADGRVEPGVIVRATGTLALHWLPLAQAAWMTVPPSRAHAWFVSRAFPNVTLLSNGSVSIIGTVDASKQFKKLAVSEELTVSVLEPVSVDTVGIGQYAVEAFPTGVLLAFEHRSTVPLQVGDELTVEVDRRTLHPRSLVAVKAGERTLTLDLPNWMIRSDIEQSFESDAHRLFREWLASPVYEQPPANVADLSDESLARALCAAYGHHERTGRAIVGHARVATTWVERNLRREEVYAPFALMALLVLSRASEHGPTDGERSWGRLRTLWRAVAAQIARDVGQRALRSGHVEVLATHWLGARDLRERREGLWKRLNGLVELLPGPHNDDKLRVLRQFCEAVDLRDRAEHYLISDALFAAVGNLDRQDHLLPAAVVCGRLVTLARMLPRGEMPLIEPQRRQYAELLDMMIAGNRDIVLLRGFRIGA